MNEDQLEELAGLMLMRIDQLAKGQSERSTCNFDVQLISAIRYRIRYLSEAYGLQWLVQQNTLLNGNLDALDEAALICLLRDMERARECRVEGISYDDANLVKNTAAALEQAQRN